MPILSVCAFMGLIYFMIMVVIYRTGFFKDELKETDLIFNAYNRLFGIFLGCFTYVLIVTFYPDITPVESIGSGLFVGVAAVFAIAMMEKDGDETPIEFFWEKFSSHRRKLFLCLVLVLGVMFIPIVNLQLGWKWAIAGFCIIAGIPLFLIRIDYYFDGLAERRIMIDEY